MPNQKTSNPKPSCLSDETIAALVEGLLSDREKSAVEEHLNRCWACQELVTVQSKIARQQQGAGLSDVPAEVIQKARDLMDQNLEENIWELTIEFSEKMFQAIKTSGEILWGPGIKSNYALRGQPTEPAKTLVVQKRFDLFRAEAIISRDREDLHNLRLRLKPVSTGMIPSPLRVTLWMDREELESHPLLDGEAHFQKMKPGSYRLEVTDASQKLAEFVLQLTKV